MTSSSRSGLSGERSSSFITSLLLSKSESLVFFLTVFLADGATFTSVEDGMVASSNTGCWKLRSCSLRGCDESRRDASAVLWISERDLLDFPLNSTSIRLASVSSLCCEAGWLRNTLLRVPFALGSTDCNFVSAIYLISTTARCLADERRTPGRSEPVLAISEAVMSSILPAVSAALSFDCF